MKSSQEYVSPLRKLVVFFERSRDRWKQKCLQAKQGVRGLQGRLRAVERSRDHWKRKAQQLQRDLTQQKTCARQGQTAAESD